MVLITLQLYFILCLTAGGIILQQNNSLHFSDCYFAHGKFAKSKVHLFIISCLLALNEMNELEHLNSLNIISRFCF